MKNRILYSAIILLGSTGILESQTVISPNSALRSHETLEIKKIDLTAENTTIYLSVENRITGGTFCADKNIYISAPDGSRVNIISSNGIPVCPDVYRFRSPGERLDFVLNFPPLVKGTPSINLIEDCHENCFSFYGVVLDPDLNKKIDDAFTHAEKSEPAAAIVGLAGIAEETGNKNPGAEGLIYLNLVKLYISAGNRVKAAEWYKKIESCGLPEAPLYLKHLNSLGIKF